MRFMRYGRQGFEQFAPVWFRVGEPSINFGGAEMHHRGVIKRESA